ncbi:MAG: tetratricopeptide repeat protein [Planctomycetota bacterium]|nr:tetratricopeptide repeat protein [Planctomycetota bacterium]
MLHSTPSLSVPLNPLLLLSVFICIHLWFLPPALAQDLLRDTIPNIWLDQYIPEKLPELKYPAYYTDLDKAKAQVFAGRYKTALFTLQSVTKGDVGEIASVKASALAAVGRREEALSILSTPNLPPRPSLEVKKAQILADLGRLDEAATLLKSLLQTEPDSLPAHFYLGQISEQKGDLDTGKSAYEWIHKTYYDPWQGQGFKEFDDAEQVTLMGRAFDRYATLTGAYANNPRLNNLILKVFVQAYDIIDRTYYPAHVAAAEFFLSRGDTKQATDELKPVLAANPNDPTAHKLLSHIAIGTFNFDGADQQIAALRAVDRNSVEADLLETRTLLQQRRPKDAERPVNRVLGQQPNNIEALSLLASASALQLKEDKVKTLLAQVEKLDLNNASAYFELADALGAMRQYPSAEKMYEIAIDRAPWWTAPRNGLGLLLTQSGDEDKAKIVLDAAYALDPFNFRTTNYLILLDKLAKMARKETDHFIILYDAQQDPILADYFADYLESVYKAVCSDFRYEPPVKTMIEVFPTHDAFSVRTTGSPWIGTVGASTGRVIAMVAPRRGKNTLGPFNFAQVLRHEFTHTVTLAATENRIGHWLTEGLAVAEEHSPIRFEWAQMLYHAATQKQLFSMDDLTWAFVRPKKPQDRQLAYAQSFWTCQYIEGKWSRDALLQMMAAFKSGKTQEQVFQDVLKLTPAAFSTEFFAWAEKQVQGWGYDPETTQKANELTKKAESQTESRQFADAVQTWEEVAKLHPMAPLAPQRLAGLYLTKDSYNPPKAAEHLLRLNAVSLKDNRFAKRLSRLYLDDLKDLPKAQQYATDALHIEPYDLDAHELLAAIFEKTNNAPALARERQVIPALKQWLADNRKSTLISEDKR